MLSEKNQKELRRADQLRQEFERMVYAHEQCRPDERGWYLLAHWSLIIEHHVAIVGLVERELYGSAAAGCPMSRGSLRDV